MNQSVCGCPSQRSSELIFADQLEQCLPNNKHPLNVIYIRILTITINNIAFSGLYHNKHRVYKIGAIPLSFMRS